MSKPAPLGSSFVISKPLELFGMGLGDFEVKQAGGHELHART
jgi:hypothetical protein